MALRRHRNLERRMKRDEQLNHTLHNMIAEYYHKGYVRKLDSNEIPEVKWFLPIFPIKNPNKPGKIRIVWDAAAKSSHGLSLNCMLLQGPDLLCSLLNILLCFRLGQIAIAGDIREMFHQISMRREDQMYQCFYWTEQDGELAVYTMTVLTFGACCSPCTAQFVKNRNAERFQTTHPKAYEAIVHSHYVDDLLVSVETESEALQLINDVKTVHSARGFEMRNWISNCKSVEAYVNGSVSSEQCMNFSSKSHVEKVLGMWWDTALDVLTYKVWWHRYDTSLLTGNRSPTKREMLQVLMSIFDPLGLIAHFLGYLKVVLQDVWRSRVDWDEPVHIEELKKWMIWIKLLPQIEQVKITRCYSQQYSINDAEDVQLHTFVDAGGSGMAAIVFLRVVHGQNVRCSIVTSKTKVAPLKLTSVPRMELQAALIGARLASTVEKALKIKISRKIFWSDSRDVLCWINSDHRRYSLFVGFRVTEILELSESKEWRYIPIKQNVADDATKWTHPPNLSNDSRWFKGPDFLYEDEHKWPYADNVNNSTDNELKANVLVHTVSATPTIHVEKYSSWRQITKVVGWIKRFVHNIRNRVHVN
ncbi:uncharacterized protein LOC133392122 [Anopheles gambiae]|uniref:uncharacterized protein LOC133392122 n=1 Tax=Anopheles gambiae TaxID=7165 RepID=UPI002AC978E3|nr:uncharacterized protein LOC133392122 [Anopheles gambiae]